MCTEQLQINLSGVREVLDTTGVDLDIELPDGVDFRRGESAEITGLGPASALMVLAGPNSPTHSVKSKPGITSSATVGTSGINAERCADDSASTRTVPALT